jgi:hypothetical protein
MIIFSEINWAPGKPSIRPFFLHLRTLWATQLLNTGVFRYPPNAKGTQRSDRFLNELLGNIQMTINKRTEPILYAWPVMSLTTVSTWIEEKAKTPTALQEKVASVIWISCRYLGIQKWSSYVDEMHCDSIHYCPIGCNREATYPGGSDKNTMGGPRGEYSTTLSSSSQ